MKFRSIKITNFMRYKGENVIEFSCDPLNNVTVVLGDNTFGKTTIAQAFRWGLYGEVITTRYVKSKDVVLLNNEILGDMDANNRKVVSVEIEVEEDDYKYQFIRKATFGRKFPQFVAHQTMEKLLMRIYENGEWSDFIDNDGNPWGKNPGLVEERIKLMFPKELSNYFFFDGERWSDEKNTKADIENSINTIMGISPLVQMIRHLREYGSAGKKSVIKQLQSKMVSSDSKSDSIKKELNNLYEEIEIYNKNIEYYSNAAIEYRSKIDISEEILNSNKRVEDDQKEAIKLEKLIKQYEGHVDSYYSDIVKLFSKAHTYFATPLFDEVVKLLEGVDLDGKDIPHITVHTINYLINEQRCICGHEILEGSMEHRNLIELKKVIPPEVIGSTVGKFKDKLSEWSLEAKDFYNDINEKANLFEGQKAALTECEEELERINKKIDGQINFGLERNKMEANKRNERDALENVRKNELNLIEYTKKVESYESELNELASHNEENKKLEIQIAYAKELYDITCNALKSKEEPLFNELNEIIKDNYEIMFNEKEKYAKLGEDYKLRLYYNRVSETNGFRDYEEYALSEGELIARNFVFIVSILQLASKKKAEEVDSGEDSDVLNLPLVLDAPFSKLSGKNISLIASVLPSAAEQVIIFMLDKDWESSKLEKYTDRRFKYIIEKEIDSNSASISNYHGGV